MKHRIRRVAPVQVAKVMGVLYGIMGLCFVPIFLFVGSVAPTEPDEVLGTGFSTTLALVMPVLYGGFGFIFTLIGAALYNLVASFVGGIEVEFDTATVA